MQRSDTRTEMMTREEALPALKAVVDLVQKKTKGPHQALIVLRLAMDYIQDTTGIQILGEIKGIGYDAPGNA